MLRCTRWLIVLPASALSASFSQPFDILAKHNLSLSDRLLHFRSVLNQSLNSVVDASFEQLDAAIQVGLDTRCSLYRKIETKLSDPDATIKISVIGGSVTMGAGHDVWYEKRWSQRLQNYLDATWGQGKFVIDNIAIGAVSVSFWAHHIHRFKDTDILFIDTGINDSLEKEQIVKNAHEMIWSFLRSDQNTAAVAAADEGIKETDEMNDTVIETKSAPAVYEIATQWMVAPHEDDQGVQLGLEIIPSHESILKSLASSHEISLLSYAHLEMESFGYLPLSQQIAFWNGTLDAPLYVHPDSSAHALIGKLVGYALWKDLSLMHTSTDCVTNDYVHVQQQSSVSFAPFQSVHCPDGPLLEFWGFEQPRAFPATTSTFMLHLAAAHNASSLFQYRRSKRGRILYDDALLEVPADNIGNWTESANNSSLDLRENDNWLPALKYLLEVRSPLLAYAQVGGKHAAWRYRADANNKYGWVIEVDDAMIRNVCGPPPVTDFTTNHSTESPADYSTATSSPPKYWCALAEILFSLAIPVQLSAKPVLKLFRVRSYTDVFNVSARVWIGNAHEHARSVSGSSDPATEKTRPSSMTAPAIFTPIRGLQKVEQLQGFDVFWLPDVQEGTHIVHLTLDHTSFSHDPPYKWKLDGLISC